MSFSNSNNKKTRGRRETSTRGTSSSLVSLSTPPFPPRLAVGARRRNNRSPESSDTYPPMADSSPAPGTLLNHNHRAYICVSISMASNKIKACQTIQVYSYPVVRTCLACMINTVIHMILVGAGAGYYSAPPAVTHKASPSEPVDGQVNASLPGACTTYQQIRRSKRLFLLLTTNNYSSPRFVSVSNHVWFARLVVSVDCL